MVRKGSSVRVRQRALKETSLMAGCRVSRVAKFQIVAEHQRNIAGATRLRAGASRAPADAFAAAGVAAIAAPYALDLLLGAGAL